MPLVILSHFTSTSFQSVRTYIHCIIRQKFCLFMTSYASYPLDFTRIYIHIYTLGVSPGYSIYVLLISSYPARLRFFLLLV